MADQLGVSAGTVKAWGVRHLCRADAFPLVAGLIWLCGHIQMETCWSAPLASRSLLSVHREDRTQPDIGRLNWFIFKMILAAYKYDVHSCEQCATTLAHARSYLDLAREMVIEVHL
jgi:hypothetical protein